jgi:hypothetical protein
VAIILVVAAFAIGLWVFQNWFGPP